MKYNDKIDQGFTCDLTLARRIRAYCGLNGINFSAFVERAVKDYLRDLGEWRDFKSSERR